MSKSKLKLKSRIKLYFIKREVSHTDSKNRKDIYECYIGCLKSIADNLKSDIMKRTSEETKSIDCATLLYENAIITLSNLYGSKSNNIFYNLFCKIDPWKEFHKKVASIITSDVCNTLLNLKSNNTFNGKCADPKI